jgi:predicted Rossmann fold nucleotide-binding protein DprA/Smf involved in DNA uptake
MIDSSIRQGIVDELAQVEARAVALRKLLGDLDALYPNAAPAERRTPAKERRQTERRTDRGDRSEQVLQAIAGGAKNPREIAAATSLNYPQVRPVLTQLRDAGKVTMTGRAAAVEYHVVSVGRGTPMQAVEQLRQMDS